MKKFIVETYYTCTFKTVHTLDNLNDQELSQIDNRTDGDVEVIDVKLNNRKTKKLGENKKGKSSTVKFDKSVQGEIVNKINNSKKDNKVVSNNISNKEPIKI